jgi:hypothetical protein
MENVALSLFTIVFTLIVILFIIILTSIYVRKIIQTQKEYNDRINNLNNVLIGQETSNKLLYNNIDNSLKHYYTELNNTNVSDENDYRNKLNKLHMEFEKQKVAQESDYNKKMALLQKQITDTNSNLITYQESDYNTKINALKKEYDDVLRKQQSDYEQKLSSISNINALITPTTFKSYQNTMDTNKSYFEKGYQNHEKHQHEKIKTINKEFTEKIKQLNRDIEDEVSKTNAMQKFEVKNTNINGNFVGGGKAMFSSKFDVKKIVSSESINAPVANLNNIKTREIHADKLCINGNCFDKASWASIGTIKKKCETIHSDALFMKCPNNQYLSSMEKKKNQETGKPYYVYKCCEIEGSRKNCQTA